MSQEPKLAAEPKSIEANLVSLSAIAGALGVVLLLALVIVQQALGGSLQQMQTSTLPAQQAVAGTQHAVGRLFQRQAQVLATRSQAELEQYRERASIEHELNASRTQLADALQKILGADAAAQSENLAKSLSVLVTEDQSLFDSVERRHAHQGTLDEVVAAAQTTLQKLIQETRAVSGNAHLQYVLLLRRLVNSHSTAGTQQLVYGGERLQQEAAEQAVASVLHLGQLVGKIALARTDDELNSIAANELAQNLDRSRSHLRALLSALDSAQALYPRALQMQQSFDEVAAKISDPKVPGSLMNLRRAVLREAENSSLLRKQLLQSVSAFSTELERAEAVVTHETERSARSANITLWSVRLGTLLVFLGAIWVGLRSVRHMRQSVEALREQNTKLASLSGELQTLNEGLEGVVAQRSAQLQKREHSMRLVLDSMDEALVMVDLNGEIVGESSKAANDWFGTAPPGFHIWDYVLPDDVKLRDQFRVGFEQIAEDILPFDASIACLPQRFEQTGKIYSLNVRQVFEEGRFSSVLCAAKDITSQVAAEGREREAREQQLLLANLLKDKSGFRAFVREGEALLADLRTQPELETATRALHTLKGNTAVYGMESVARYCHSLEDRLADGADCITSAELDELTTLWRSRIHKIETMVTSDAAIELGEAEYSEIVHALRSRKDYDDLSSLVESWKWGATSAHLQRLSRQVRRVAERLDKPVEVTIEHHQLRLMPGPLDSFWGSLVHVVRNAVDHGIESPTERVEAGKGERGKIILRTLLQEEAFVVELEDDGRGINFDELTRVARAKGLPSETQEDLIAAMFHDGVTTRLEATELSGRGVGLAAVAECCLGVGGRIECDTGLGQGTTFRFLFPSAALKIRQGAAVERTESVRPSRRRAV